MCYLDLADAFAGHRWLEAFNSYWSPLYPWMQSWVVPPLAPSPKWQVPAAQIVNLLIYLLTFGCFELFLRRVLYRFHNYGIRPSEQQVPPRALGLAVPIEGLGRDDNFAGYGNCETALEGTGPAAESEPAPLPEAALLAVAYSLFLWTSLHLIRVEAVGADMLVAAAVYVIAALLLRIQSGAPRSAFVMLGLVLGIAYWAKAVMFPLGLVFLVLGWFAVPKKRDRFLSLAIATLMFAIVSAPLVAVLSYKVGRFTFGDSGWLNYSAFVSPGVGVRNWQGEPPASGVPVHPTRLIFQHPPVFEFATPIGGTYPPTYDPAYWNVGRRWTFDLRAQTSAIARHLPMYAELLLHSQSGLLAGVVALLAVGRKPALVAILRGWPLLAMCFAAFGIYALVHAETRFLCAYVAILWITILTGVRLPRQVGSEKLASALLWAVAITLQISVLSSTAHAWRDADPCSARPQVEVAEELNRIGIHAASKVAVLGDGDWAFWAGLAHLRIVAEIGSADVPEFWASAAQQKTKIYELLAKAGASAVVTPPPPAAITPDDSWVRLGHTPYYIRWLKQP